jgi:hypothetical protein
MAAAFDAPEQRDSSSHRREIKMKAQSSPGAPCLRNGNALRLFVEGGDPMPAPAERMRQMRERRRKRGLRELRIVVPDSRLVSVRRRVAAQVARLIPGDEDDALSWIEAVSEFDSPDRQADDEAR